MCADCTDDNYGTEDWCNSSDGMCVHAAKADATYCGCIFGGSCDDGACDCQPHEIELNIP